MIKLKGVRNKFIMQDIVEVITTSGYKALVETERISGDEEFKKYVYNIAIMGDANNE